MPVYDNKVSQLMEQFVAADEAEGAATQALLAYMQSGANDRTRMKELGDAMTSAHDNKMQIYAQMQKFRLDN